MMIDGATAPASPTRLSFAAWRLLDYVPILKAQTWPAATRWEWRKSCCYSGGSLRDDVGGRASSSRALREWRENSKYGFAECGR